jgi:hypothetical protein
MSRLRVPALLIVLLAPLAFILPAADAGHRAPWHWETSGTPFDVRFIDSVPNSWDDVLTKAANEWSESDVLDAVVEGGSDSRKVRRTCPMTLNAVRVCSFRYGATGWVGLTQIQLQGKHIRRASIKLNETYFANPNRKSTCHELGHGLGLAHRSETSSCMTQGQGVSMHPDGHDYRMLERIYGHSHRSSTAADEDGGEWRIVTIKHPA